MFKCCVCNGSGRQDTSNDDDTEEASFEQKPQSEIIDNESLIFKEQVPTEIEDDSVRLTNDRNNGTLLKRQTSDSDSLNDAKEIVEIVDDSIVDGAQRVPSKASLKVEENDREPSAAAEKRDECKEVNGIDEQSEEPSPNDVSPTKTTDNENTCQELGRSDYIEDRATNNDDVTTRESVSRVDSNDTSSTSTSVESVLKQNRSEGSVIEVVPSKEASSVDEADLLPPPPMDELVNGDSNNKTDDLLAAEEERFKPSVVDTIVKANRMPPQSSSTDDDISPPIDFRSDSCCEMDAEEHLIFDLRRTSDDEESSHKSSQMSDEKLPAYPDELPLPDYEKLSLPDYEEPKFDEPEAILDMEPVLLEQLDCKLDDNSNDSPRNSLISNSSLVENGSLDDPEMINDFTTIANTDPTKSLLYTAPGYIERTIYDGPEDEGDDSVFESHSASVDDTCKKKDPPPVPPIPQWLSQEEEEEEDNKSEDFGGMQEPPATPVARDELALRRHRFFSDLLHAAKTSMEHKVKFDPLGPLVHAGAETDEREEHFEELVTRLENVTKRLEKVVTPVKQTQETGVQTKTPSPTTSPKLSGLNSPTDQSSTSTSSSSAPTLRSTGKTAETMSVAGYQDVLGGSVRDYLQLSNKIGGDVAAHSKLVEKAFQIQMHFIETAASRPAPTNQTEQVGLLGPTSTQIQAIQEFREKNRGSPFFNHLSAISESIPALGWVAVAPTPAPYVKEMNDAGQFYTNRVLKEWKEKDKTHVEWCKAWVQTLTDLNQYVRQHHTTGLVWAKTANKGPGGPPPPPPPSMMPMPDIAPLNVNDERSALFAEINQGENITKNLKKVTSDMQTHKNASIRTGPAPFKAPTANNTSPMKTVPPANAPITKPPVFARDGKKWLVEYQNGNKNLLIENAEMNNVVYMFRCHDSTLVVKGKINSVVIDSCRKSSVVFDSLVSGVEFVNCQSVQMQVLGKVPTISVDKTDGCQMYLSPESLGVELISSKSSEMNVMVPKGNGDYVEYPVPEQFKTTVSLKGLNTTAVDSLG